MGNRGSAEMGNGKKKGNVFVSDCGTAGDLNSQSFYVKIWPTS